MTTTQCAKCLFSEFGESGLKLCCSSCGSVIPHRITFQINNDDLAFYKNEKRNPEVSGSLKKASFCCLTNRSKSSFNCSAFRFWFQKMFQIMFATFCAYNMNRDIVRQELNLPAALRQTTWNTFTIFLSSYALVCQYIHHTYYVLRSLVATTYFELYLFDLVWIEIERAEKHRAL